MQVLLGAEGDLGGGVEGGHVPSPPANHGVRDGHTAHRGEGCNNLGTREGGMEGWRDGGIEIWRDGGIESWSYGGMGSWRDGWMDSWRD